MKWADTNTRNRMIRVIFYPIFLIIQFQNIWNKNITIWA